jgi:hypothetical protein
MVLSDFLLDVAVFRVCYLLIYPLFSSDRLRAHQKENDHSSHKTLFNIICSRHHVGGASVVKLSLHILPI